MSKHPKSGPSTRLPASTAAAFNEVRAGKDRRVKNAKALFDESNTLPAKRTYAPNIAEAEIHPTRGETLSALAVGRALTRKSRVNAELLKLIRYNSDLFLEDAMRPYTIGNRMFSEVLSYLREARGSEIGMRIRPRKARS